MVDFTHGDTLLGEIFEKGTLTRKSPLLIKITLCELMCTGHYDGHVVRNTEGLTKSYGNDNAPHYMVFSIFKGAVELKQLQN